MKKGENTKPYDLEERTFLYARDVRALVKRLPRTIANIEDAKQVIRASGSVGANYIEANEALSVKDFRMRIKISKKEAKESAYFLRLLYVANDADLDQKRNDLVQEARELVNILGSILHASEKN